jgi:hypothetical protein
MSSLFNLPLEIRREIYTYVLPAEDSINVGPNSDIYDALSALTFCKDSREESNRIFYESTELANDAVRMLAFFEAIGPENRSHVRRISIEVNDVRNAQSARSILELLGSHRSLKTLVITVYDSIGLTSSRTPASIRKDAVLTYSQLFRALTAVDYVDILKVAAASYFSQEHFACRLDFTILEGFRRARWDLSG